MYPYAIHFARSPVSLHKSEWMLEIESNVENGKGVHVIEILACTTVRHSCELLAMPSSMGFNLVLQRTVGLLAVFRLFLQFRAGGSTSKLV